MRVIAYFLSVSISQIDIQRLGILTYAVLSSWQISSSWRKRNTSTVKFHLFFRREAAIIQNGKFPWFGNQGSFI